MTIAQPLSRPLGTMVAYGYPEVDFGAELGLAASLGARVLEILPLWQAEPDPESVRERASGAGLAIHSAHGCWGGQSIRAYRVDLGQTDPKGRRESVDDIRRCIDWLRRAGGAHLIVHPGGLSDPADLPGRREALGESLNELADHAREAGVGLCVENMPPGVFPGSRMAELRALLDGLGRTELSLALDTGHAHISATAASETRAAGDRLGSTHVHDNDGRQDTHLPPGLGTIDWQEWRAALDEVRYAGPIMLECIRHVRRNPHVIDASFQGRLARLCSVGGELAG